MGVKNGLKMVINKINYYRICCKINVLGIHNKNTQKNARSLQTKQNIFVVN